MRGRWRIIVFSNIFLISGEVKSKVLSRELHGKISDEKKIAEVMAALPVRVENTLSNYRDRVRRRKN